MSLFLDVQLQGIDVLANYGEELREKFRKEMRGQLKKAADVLIRAEREFSKSERVDRAISANLQVGSPDDFQVVIGVETKKAFFAHFLEKGTKATVGPGPKGGHHVATRAFPFREPSLEATEEAIFALIGLQFVPRPGEYRHSLESARSSNLFKRG